MVPRIAEIDGKWWPTSDWQCRRAVQEEMPEHMDWFLRHTHDRSLVIQAGGNVGAYPSALSAIFERVLTFEPDEVNYTCLMHNIRSLGDIKAEMAALGDKRGTCSIRVVDEHNCGAHQIEPEGSIPIITIDSLHLDICGAIWLDVEGYELPALKGAAKTIERFSPIIACEEKGLGDYPDHAIADYLATFGYRELSRCNNDRLYGRD